MTWHCCNVVVVLTSWMLLIRPRRAYGVVLLRKRLSKCSSLTNDVSVIMIKGLVLER